MPGALQPVHHNLATALSRLARLLRTMRDYLAATRDHVVVFDGGMGATLEQLDLSLERDYKLPGRAHEALVLNRPDVIEWVHQSFIDAGADARFVAGSIGPTGYLPASDDPTLGNISFRTLAETFAEQAHGLIEGGVAVILIETA